MANVLVLFGSLLVYSVPPILGSPLQLPLLSRYWACILLEGVVLSLLPRLATKGKNNNILTATWQNKLLYYPYIDNNFLHTS